MKKTYIKIALGALLLSASSTLFSQNVAINTSGNAAYVSAILDLSNNNTAGLVGFLPPYVSLPATGFGLNGTATQSGGIIVYNTASTLSGIGLYTWNTTTSSWIFIGSGISGVGINNYLARWGTPTSLTVGVSQDNGSAAGVSQAAITFTTATSLFTVVAPITTYTNAILATSQVTGGLGVIGGNSVSGVGSTGVEGYIGTEAAPAAAVAVYGLANAGTGTQIGVQGTVTGAATKNVGAAFSASGATTNYGLIVPAGQVGIGNAAPAAATIADFTNTAATNGKGNPLLWPINSDTNHTSIAITAADKGAEFYNSTDGCFYLYNGSAWQLAGCPCTKAPTGNVITASCSGPFQGGSTVYTSNITQAVSYVWTAASNSGTPVVANGGSVAATVTWPTNATTGTVTCTLSNLCGATSTTFSTVVNKAALTGGATTVLSGSSGIYTYTATAGYASYTWSASNGNATVTGASNIGTVTGVSAGPFVLNCTITAAASGATPGCSVVLSFLDTVKACGNITQDYNPLSSCQSGNGGGFRGGSPTMTLTTTDPNDMVLVVCTGLNYECTQVVRFTCTGSTSPSPSNASVAYAGPSSGTANFFKTFTVSNNVGEPNTNNYVPIEILWFDAVTPGTYTMTVTEPAAWYFPGRYQNFGLALTGFCSTPAATDIQTGSPLDSSAVYTQLCNGLVYNLLSKNILGGGALVVGSYIFAAMNNLWYGGAGGPEYYDFVGNVAGTGGTVVDPYIQQNSINNVDGTTSSICGQAVTTVPTPICEVEGNDLNGICLGTMAVLIIH